MKDLYTDLSLAQKVKMPTGVQTLSLENYQELFDVQETTEKQQEANPKKTKIRKKILAKGDPGTGKSTFGKKSTYDWAKGVFTAVSVVFFVSLKLIRPGPEY